MTVRVVPSIQFALLTRQGRVAVVLEAQSESQADRRLLWLRTHTRVVLPPAHVSCLVRYDVRKCPIPGGALCIPDDVFEEADIY